MFSLQRSALRDSLAVVSMMPNVALVAFTILLGMDAVSLTLGGVSTLAVIAIKIAGAALLALYSIAVYRFVILGDVAAHYPLAFGRRGRRFIAAEIVLAVIAVVPVLIASGVIAVFAVAGARMHSPWPALIAGLISICALAAFLGRLTVVFPAIAVDAPGAGWTNAYRDTSGQTLRIFFIYFIGGVLFAVAGIVLMALLWSGTTLLGHLMSSGFGGVALARVSLHVGLAALSVLSVTYFVALTSHIFEAVADRLTVA